MKRTVILNQKIGITVFSQEESGDKNDDEGEKKLDIFIKINGTIGNKNEEIKCCTTPASIRGKPGEWYQGKKIYAGRKDQFFISLLPYRIPVGAGSNK